MTSKEIYLIYGPPASGKTVATREAIRDMDIQYISVGEIVRPEIAKNSFLGQELNYYLQIDQPYPPSLIAKTVEPSITSSSSQKLVIDGYPKYPEESRPFIEMLESHSLGITAIAIINQPVEVTIERVKDRRICTICHTQTTILESEAICPKCLGSLTMREDDLPTKIIERYTDFQKSIQATLKSLSGKYKAIYQLDSTQPIEQVAKKLKTVFTNSYMPE